MAFPLPSTRSSKEQDPSPSTRTMNSSKGKSTSNSRGSIRSAPTKSAKETKIKQKKTSSFLDKRLTLDTVAVLVTGFICCCLLLFLLFEILNNSGSILLPLVGSACLILISLFCTTETILNRKIKWWGLVALITAAIVVASAMTTLILQTQIQNDREMNKKKENDTKIIQRVSAITIVVMVFHILAIGHHLYVKFSKRLMQIEADHSNQQPRSNPPSNRMAYMVEGQ